VGITRARHWLALSWPTERRTKVSPFVEEASGRPPDRREKPMAAERAPSPMRGDPLFERLRGWRRDRAQGDGVPPYVVFHDKTLAAIAEARPTSPAALLEIAGVGPAKVERYAAEILALIGEG
jgi:superfamily II DNA helicase RecQ